jgi:hypothetical protein
MTISKNIKIEPNGTVSEFNPQGEKFTLKELQEGVGGYIEMYLTKDGKRLIILNEEGKIDGLPLNIVATSFFNTATTLEDVLVGNVLIVDANLVD